MHKFPFLLLFILMAATFNLKAQTDCAIPLDADDNTFKYGEVVEVAGVNKDELFERAMAWIKNEYVNAANKLDADAKEKGVIDLDGRFRVEERNSKGKRQGDMIVEYRLNILFKDGRYKYEFYKFHLNKGYFFALERWLDPNVTEAGTKTEECEQVNDHILEKIAAMKEAIANPEVEEEEEW
ncbi:MAG: DUF4468 domain-containing protein [Bacteroidia bacterium]